MQLGWPHPTGRQQSGQPPGTFRVEIEFFTLKPSPLFARLSSARPSNSTGRTMLRNYINATLGFRELEQATGVPCDQPNAHV
jgi:hypothetical protein